MIKKEAPARSAAPQAQAPVPQDQPQERPAVPAGLIWTFWGAVAAAVIAARVWTAVAPQTPDRVIERWVMLAFAAFLAVFLAKIK